MENKKDEKKDEKKEEKPLENLDKLKEEIKEKEEEKIIEKVKRTHKKKEPEIELDNQQTSLMLDWMFKVIADRYGHHWILTVNEANQGAILINKIILKYAPIIGKYSEEFALLMWTTAILIPRLRTPASPLPIDNKKEEK